MSSTLVISPAASPDGATYFAKNSNRPPNECQLVVTLPQVADDATSLVKCTHITIPQVNHRHAIILSRPWWSWGGEMGANDQGVVIGCERVQTRDHEAEPGLLAMDFVRLGLERGASAGDALDVITALLQTHGQGGASRFEDPVSSHDSSFIIADSNEVWLLETAGRHWAAKRIPGRFVLGTALTLTTDYERSSYALTQYARSRGWSRAQEDIHFADTLGPRFRIKYGRDHQQREWLLEEAARLDQDPVHLGLMKLLRLRKKPQPRHGSKMDIALHAGGAFHHLQTTGSMVARVSTRRMDFFLTGTSAPDLSVFKPVFFDLPMEPDLAGEDLSHYDERSFWWRHEKYHRTLITASRLDPQPFRERDEVESKLVEDIATHKGRQLTQIRRRVQADVLDWEKSWKEKFEVRKSIFLSLHPFTQFWKRQNRLSGMIL